MIAYEDLVTALTVWRARKGLPVSSLAGTAEAAPVTSASVPASGPARSGPPGPPPRSAPPGPPPRAVPPPLAPAEDPLMMDDALLDDAHYESEGGEFEGATAVGVAPERPSETTTPTGRSSKRHDW
jgi:hypothetical protein